MNKNIENLNNEQKSALFAIDGAVLVTAGAGSGKTRLLTHRIAYLLDELNISPQNILAITFTNKASNEMKERVKTLAEEGNSVWISTFHSMCVRILRQHISELNNHFDKNFSIYSDSDSEKVLKTLLPNENVKDSKLLKQIMFHTSNMKNNNFSIEAYRREIDFNEDADFIISIIKNYQEYLLKNNALDFDDLLIKTNELFVACPEVLNYYADKFKYILVDEFQDTNIIQYELVKKLASQHKNVFVVGDEDQCIYTWRGANFQNIENFTKDFENVKIFKLEQNYRSTKKILEFANKLIKHNKSRIDKTLWSGNVDGQPVVQKELYDEQAEADFIAKTIHDLVSREGFSYNDFAILVRFNALTFPFEEKLLSYDIPYKIYGGFKFYERVEVKNILAYLRLFINPKDDQAFLRIVNFPKRGVGDTSIEKIKEIANNAGKSMFQLCLEDNNTLPSAIKMKLSSFIKTYTELFSEYEITPLGEFARTVVEKFNIKFAYNNNSQEDFYKLANIDQLLHAIETYAIKNPDDTLSDYLQTISLISDIDNLGEDENVTLATMHAVKGLEFRAVFLIGLEEKVMPISRAYDDEMQMEEERRLMYVGITRAKERLFLTNCKTRYLYGRRDYMAQSRFLSELGFAKKFEQKTIYNSTASRQTASQVDYVKKALSTSTAYDNYVKTTEKNISQYEIGQTVLHTRFGIGIILDIDFESKTADIDFTSFGTRTLMLEIAPLKIIK